MSESSYQERTEEATPRKREESARKGQVPRSRDLGAFLVMTAGILYLFMFGGGLVEDLLEVVRGYLEDIRYVGSRGGGVKEVLGSMMEDCARLIAPLLVVLVVVAGISSVLIGGWNFTFEALGWKFDRLSIYKGLARIVSMRALLEMAKAIMKVVVVGFVGVVAFSFVRDELVLLGMAPLEVGVSRGLSIVLGVSIILLGPLALIAIVDVPMQIFQHHRQLRMTKQEIREEMKGTEGRPEVKGRIRRLQQELATRRMMDAVRDSDVVVNNPTHYSVAVKYDEDKMRAPIVVATGKDLVAHRIRATAVDAGVPQVEWPLLARTLHSNVKLGEEVPVNLYIAVAKVLSYVFALRSGTSRGGNVGSWSDGDITEASVED